MMLAMSKRTKVTAGDVARLSSAARVRTRAMAGAWCMLALAGCGGGAKQADSPGTCPEGTVLNGESCVPETSSAARPKEDDAPKGNTNGSTATASGSGSGSNKSGDDDVGAYDKDAVDAQLKRAAKQVKENCGSASDEDGNKNGPWGSTTATVVLGRNGHVQDVTLPAPYSGKPVGDCVVNSFKKIQFPPYGGSTDVSVPWDVQIVQPKHK
jgi:hypothetical protein